MRKNQMINPLLATALFMAVILSGPSARADSSAKLVCDIWPPYEFQTENGVTGMSVEIVEAVYKQLDVTQIEIQPFPWKRAIDAIRFNEADAIFSASHTPGRALFLRYPDEPLFISSWIIWTKTNSSIQTLDDLKGKKIGVVQGFSYTLKFWDFIRTYCQVEEAHKDDTNFKMLSLGRVDAIAAEYGNGLKLVQALGDKTIKPVPGIEIKRSGMYIAFNREHTSEEFVRRFSDELRAFKQTDEHRAIREKYLGIEKCW